MNYELVVIGANNGNLPLPIEYPCLLVEPIPHLYKKLTEIYPNAQCAELAIYTEDKEIDFYFCRTMSTVSGIEIKTRWQRKKQSIGRMKLIKVNAVTLNTLFNMYNVSGIKILTIDTEGFDGIILKQIFQNSKIRPKKIIYEYKHLSKEEKNQLLKLFIENKYTLKVKDGENNEANLIG